jgi:hypothetical protein
VIGKLSAREAYAGRTGSLDRLKTTSFTTYLEKGPEIRLSLGICYLRSLPLELFRLERLTVLILRECFFLYFKVPDIDYCSGSNKLTCIPPQIKNLKNLQELDVSVNKLRYLPAEMLQMQLFALNTNANPLLQNESPIFLPLETRAGVSKPELAGDSVIPTLRECCFRVLLRKADGSEHTNLEARYGSSQEVSVWNLSESVRHVLNDSLPGSVSVGPRTKRQKLDDGYEEETRLGMGVCPSPHHEETSYFVEPVEVRHFLGAPRTPLTFRRSRSDTLGRRGWRESIFQPPYLCSGEVAVLGAWTSLRSYQLAISQLMRATPNHSHPCHSTRV